MQILSANQRADNAFLRNLPLQIRYSRYNFEEKKPTLQIYSTRAFLQDSIFFFQLLKKFIVFRALMR